MKLPLIWREEARKLGPRDMELLGIPKRYWTRSVQELSEDCKHRDEVLAYMAELEANLKEGKGLTLHGLPGRGKTSVATAILKQAWAHGAHGRFLSVFDLDEHVLQMRRYWDDEPATMLDRLRDAHLVVLDDIRLTLSPEAARLLARVLRHRSDAMRATIVTTNLNEKGLRGLMGDADCEMLKACSPMLLVDGPNWREVPA